jgi:hypothetical protein
MIAYSTCDGEYDDDEELDIDAAQMIAEIPIPARITTPTTIRIFQVLLLTRASL